MKFLKIEVKTRENTLFGEAKIPPGAILIDGSRYGIKAKNNRDTGQRQFCGCIKSKDIGEYNTCPHQCEYCYANASKHVAIENYRKYKNNQFGEKVTG